MNKKRKAMLSELKGLSKEMSSAMGDSYAESMPTKKVTVAADTKEGLEKGLSKAQELMKKKGLMEEMEDSSECPKCEKESCECDSPEEYESEEDIKEKIERLKSKLTDKE